MKFLTRANTLFALTIFIVLIFLPQHSKIRAIEECTPSSLQSLIDNASANSTINVPPCIYREAVTVNKSLVLNGGGTAEIRGSDIWTGWTSSGSTWTSTKTVPTLNSGGECQSGTSRCLWPEQVFIDGEPMLQVASNPSGNQFSLTANRNIILGTNPSGKTVEVTTRAYWLYAGANNVTIKNFTMKHAGNAAQTGAINNQRWSTMIIENSNFSWAHGNNVQLQGGNNHKVLNNDISYGGQQGTGIGESDGSLVQGNRIYQNNTEDFSHGWSAAGDKSALVTNTTWDSNTVYDNHGPGLWCDVACNNVTYSNNSVFNNEDEGIFYEISTNAKIFGNKVWRNGFTKGNTWCYSAGILIASSDHVEVYNNTTAWNTINISMLSQIRPTTSNPDGYSDTVSIHDNVIVGQQGAGEKGLIWCGESQVYNLASKNFGSNNKYWYQETEGSYERFGYDSRGIWELADFNSTLGEENGQYISSSEKNAILNAACMPTTPTGTVPTSCSSMSSTPTIQQPTNTPYQKSGDANGDNSVNGQDYIIWLVHYGQQISGSSNGDFNNDNKVNGIDYIVWLTHYGT